MRPSILPGSSHDPRENPRFAVPPAREHLTHRVVPCPALLSSALWPSYSSGTACFFGVACWIYRLAMNSVEEFVPLTPDTSSPHESCVTPTPTRHTPTRTTPTRTVDKSQRHAYSCTHVTLTLLMISLTEGLILSLLSQSPAGAYGSELVHRSDSKLKRGSIYSLLGRLEKAGLVELIEEPPTEQYALPRTRYRISASGVRARIELANWAGFPVPQPVGSAA